MPYLHTPADNADLANLAQRTCNVGTQVSRLRVVSKCGDAGGSPADRFAETKNISSEKTLRSLRILCGLGVFSFPRIGRILLRILRIYKRRGRRGFAKEAEVLRLPSHPQAGHLRTRH